MIIIPARGGSKGVPDKNLREFAGTSLIVRAVRTGLQVADVLVTTDSSAIATAAQGAGADVVMQPAGVSGDHHLSELALLFALEQVPAKSDYFVFMQCTCPLTLPEDILGALDKYVESEADTLVTVAESITTPFIWQDHDEAIAIGHCREKRERRQDIKFINYIENGAFYVIATEGFLEYRNRFFGKTVVYKMPTYRSLDIDTEDDFRIAGAFLEIQQ